MGYFGAHFQLISSSFGAQRKCGNLKKRPHFDHINVVKMWSFYFSGSFGAHFGLIWGSRKCGQNVVIMWSKCGLFFRHENLTKMWSKCGHNVVKMWSKCGLFLRRIWGAFEAHLRRIWGALEAPRPIGSVKKPWRHILGPIRNHGDPF